MTPTSNQGYLKKMITYAVILCRIGLLALLLGLYLINWLIDSELSKLLYITLPITFLYLVFVVKYALIRKRYFVTGKELSKSYFISSFAPLVLLHLVEMYLIIFKSTIYDSNPDGLYWSVAVFECFLGAYAGFHLSDLFGQVENMPETKTPD